MLGRDPPRLHASLRQNSCRYLTPALPSTEILLSRLDCHKDTGCNEPHSGTILHDERGADVFDGPEAAPRPNSSVT
jgi:hypothetical protein